MAQINSIVLERKLVELAPDSELISRFAFGNYFTEAAHYKY
jgi:hypothetical protein